MKVALNGRRGGDRFAVTDASGRFAGRIPRDETQPFGWPVRDPLPFYESNDFPAPPQRMPKEGISELDLPPAELAEVPTVCGSLREALDSLEVDMDFLLKGDVFSKDQIEAYIEIKRADVARFEMTPSPVEFDMYYSA